jgi:hypothetical protein
MFALLPALALLLGPLLLVACPLWILGRKRIRWTGWDYAVSLLPWLWMALEFVPALAALPHPTKSLSNWVEPLFLGWISPIAPLLRVALANRINSTQFARCLFLGLLGITIGLWLLVPTLRE